MCKFYKFLSIIGVVALLVLALLSVFSDKVGEAILSLILARMIVSDLGRGVKNEEVI